MVELPVEAYCRGCGYSLRRLEVARCPECGRTFDPSDAETYRVTGIWRDRWDRFWYGRMSRVEVAALTLWAVTVVGMGGAERLTIASFGNGVYPCWGVPPLVAAWWVRAWFIRSRSRAGGSERLRAGDGAFGGMYWAVCLLLIAVSFHTDGSCVHGYKSGCGPIGWGYSKIGSPCNAPEVRYWNVTERWYVWYQPGE